MEEPEPVFPDMEDSEELNDLQVLNTLLDGSKNLDLKTDIVNPKQLAVLKMISNVMNSWELTIGGGAISDYILIFLRYNVSKDRLSRKEVVEVLSSRMAMRKDEAERKELRQ